MRQMTLTLYSTIHGLIRFGRLFFPNASTFIHDRIRKLNTCVEQEALLNRHALLPATCCVLTPAHMHLALGIALWVCKCQCTAVSI